MSPNRKRMIWRPSQALLGALFFGLAFAQAPVTQAPVSKVNSGRNAANNNRLVTTGIRSPALPSNHALIITVSAYPHSPLPGVLKDRILATELAQRFGVPTSNIDYLSEAAVTREGLQRSLSELGSKIMPGDKVYIYFSGHGARNLDRITGKCTESLVMRDMNVVTNGEFADMVKPLSSKAGKTVVMLDSCHSGGVATAAASRDVKGLASRGRAKYLAEASSAACATPVNLRGFSDAKGIEFETTDNNFVILAAARDNEVAWDTDEGGALTYNFEQCVNGTAKDEDRSGSISMQELTDCVQERLNSDEDAGSLQHLILTGNGGLVPGFSALDPLPSPPPVTPPEVNTLAALSDIYNQRDDRWNVTVTLGKPVLSIGKDDLDFGISSARDGFVYIFYRGTQPDSFYLLFPNRIDDQNAIRSNVELQVPRSSWAVHALGPPGTDHLLVMVTETPRDFGSFALPGEYVSEAGQFTKLRTTPQAMGKINEIATLSASFRQPECEKTNDRDLGVARRCSNVFGAVMVTVDETNEM